MLFIIQGDDSYLVEETKDLLFKKYRGEEHNFEFFQDSIEIADFSSAIHQVPILDEYYVVYALMNKKQFIRLKPYIVPSEFTVLIIQLTDFILKEEYSEGLSITEVFDCYSPRGRNLTKWVTKRCRSYGYSLDKEDIRKLTSMFSSLRDIDSVLFQLSFLSQFNRQEYLSTVFNVKNTFVWDLFITLITSDKKQFFIKYAEQNVQNLYAGTSQFNSKIIGGLIYCLLNWEDYPDWVEEKTSVQLQDKELYSLFLFCNLVELLSLSKKVNNMVPILDGFNNLLDSLHKFKSVRFPSRE